MLFVYYGNTRTFPNDNNNQVHCGNKNEAFEYPVNEIDEEVMQQKLMKKWSNDAMYYFKLFQNIWCIYIFNADSIPLLT